MQRLLALHPEVGAATASALTETTLDEISRQLSVRATRRAERVTLALRLLGTAALLSVALLIAGTVFLSVARLNQGIVP